MCVLSNQEMVAKAFFINIKKNTTFGQKKALVSSKVLYLAFLNTLKLFFGKMFYYFGVTFMKNTYSIISWYSIRQKAHELKKKKKKLC